MFRRGVGLSFPIVMAAVSLSQTSSLSALTQLSCSKPSSLRQTVDTLRLPSFIGPSSRDYFIDPLWVSSYAKHLSVVQNGSFYPLLNASTQLRRPHTCGIS